MPAASPPRSVTSALTWLRNRVGDRGWRRRCLELYRLAWGWTKSTGGLPTAYSGWTQTKKRHRRDYNPPPGAPCWFKGPTSAGHVCMATGNGDDVITNDHPDSDEICKSSIRAIERDWDCEYLGWTEDYPRRGDLPLDLVDDDGDRPKVGQWRVVATREGLNARYAPGTDGRLRTTVARGYRIKVREVRKVGGRWWIRGTRFWYAAEFTEVE